MMLSYHPENSRTHQNTELKPDWACLVLTWVTRGESQVTHCPFAARNVASHALSAASADSIACWCCHALLEPVTPLSMCTMPFAVAQATSTGMPSSSGLFHSHIRTFHLNQSQCKRLARSHRDLILPVTAVRAFSDGTQVNVIEENNQHWVVSLRVSKYKLQNRL